MTQASITFFVPSMLTEK
uniref:Uncharacterized protein n=1 Tax=Arundo donax TaxID=35708 RepID=A0A0A8YR98_ARUDO